MDDDKFLRVTVRLRRDKKRLAQVFNILRSLEKGDDGRKLGIGSIVEESLIEYAAKLYKNSSIDIPKVTSSESNVRDFSTVQRKEADSQDSEREKRMKEIGEVDF